MPRETLGQLAEGRAAPHSVLTCAAHPCEKSFFEETGTDLMGNNLYLVCMLHFLKFQRRWHVFPSFLIVVSSL